jgi:hypothetical protein
MAAAQEHAMSQEKQGKPKQQDMLNANARQVGGEHYKRHGLEHWDTVALFNLDYFQGNAWKYLLRWREKGGIQDLEKSKHYIEKYIEIETARAAGTLTRDLLGRAVRELENMEAETDADRYRAAAKGDDPVGDALSVSQIDAMHEVFNLSKLEMGLETVEQFLDGKLTHIDQPWASGTVASARRCLRVAIAQRATTRAVGTPGPVVDSRP